MNLILYVNIVFIFYITYSEELNKINLKEISFECKNKTNKR